MSRQGNLTSVNNFGASDAVAATADRPRSTPLPDRHRA